MNLSFSQCRALYKQLVLADKSKKRIANELAQAKSRLGTLEVSILFMYTSLTKVLHHLFKMAALFVNFSTVPNNGMHELDEIGVLCSKFWRKILENLADAIENIV